MLPAKLKTDLHFSVMHPQTYMVYCGRVILPKGARGYLSLESLIGSVVSWYGESGAGTARWS